MPIRRREFLAIFAIASDGAGLANCASAVAAGLWPRRLPNQRQKHQSLDLHVSYVRPLIGTGWHGHTYPGATTPFGLVQLSPDTSGPHVAWYAWDHSGGYHYPDKIISGFSHTHIQGTGAPELGDLLVIPVVSGGNWSWDRGLPGNGYCSSFTHDREFARPGYYAVFLETPRVKAELTASARCGMHRYTFVSRKDLKERHGILLDLVHGLGCKVSHAEIHFESPTAISGCRHTHGWAPNRQVYFVAEFSDPILPVSEVFVDGKALKALGHVSGTRVKARLIFRPPAEGPSLAGSPLLLRLGISATSIEGARRNLHQEIPHWDFDALRRETESDWEQTLSVVDATLPTASTANVFFTGLYHSLTTPTAFNDVNGSYRGEDQKNHAFPGFTKYSSISTWDICRSEFPLLTLAQPKRINSLVRTFLQDYEELGHSSLPYFPIWSDETWSKTGCHVVGLILGAYTRGFRDYDVQGVYEAMRKTVLEGATDNGNNVLLEQFRKFGFVPTGPRKESVSFTLDFAYDSWCVGAMAELLGKRNDARYFYKLGQNYRHLFDPKTGFMRGKTATGKWREPFRPDQEYWDDYTESDAWQATFNVLHDVQGLIELFGGDQAFVRKLDDLFTAASVVRDAPPDISGLIGQDAQGNEPSNHIPYLYVFAGAPWKTQYWVRRVMSRWYTDTPDGIPGNDDVGQLSSWVVLSALGFYPVNAATGVYVMGSPWIERAEIHNPETGTTFTIVAEDNSPENVYIQGIQLNGRDQKRAWLTHADITGHGELIFKMGPRPNKELGAAISVRPPSGLIHEPQGLIQNSSG